MAMATGHWNLSPVEHLDARRSDFQEEPASDHSEDSEPDITDEEVWRRHVFSYHASHTRAGAMCSTLPYSAVEPPSTRYADW